MSSNTKDSEWDPHHGTKKVSSVNKAQSIVPKKAVVVTPIKPSNPYYDGAMPAAVNVDQNENAPREDVTVTGDSYLHFSHLPELTNREIVLEHYDFVRWAKKIENPQGNLKLFTDWLKSDEATALHLEGQGNEKFTFGQHKGQKFKEVARLDPDYHTRYLRVLRKNHQQPHPTLIHYIDYVKAVEQEKRGSEKFTYGKYSGMKFCEIARIDPGYHERYTRALRDKGEEPDGILARYITYFNDWIRSHDDIESKKRNASIEPQQPLAKKARET
jgi:hypothetical protein